MRARRSSALDRALGFFGLARAKPLTPRANYYAGAAIGRLQGDWRLPAISADQLLRMDAEQLRNRAQELVMNNATAARIPRLFSENVIGKDGILLQPQIRSTRGELRTDVNQKITDAWYRWYEAEYASADGRRSFCETETLVAESEPTDGEVLIRILDGFDNPFGFTLDVLDPAQLDFNLNRAPKNGQNEIRMGVEIDAWGRAVTYHLLSNHPSDLRGQGKKYIPVKADDIIHLFVQKRPKQTRGVTWFAPVIIDLNNLGGWREAALVAARTSAAKMGFLKTINPDAPSTPLEEEDGEKGQGIRWDADPGVIEQLPDNMEFQGWDPTYPKVGFAEMDSAYIRSIAVAMGVSYMSLSGDLNGTSYGSGRIGLKAEQLVYQTLQQRLIQKFHMRVYRRWLRASLLKGALSLDSFDPARYADVIWHPRAMPWIDPKAEIDTAKEEEALGVTTITQIAASQGKDIEDNLKQRQAEHILFETYGVPHPDEIRRAEIAKALTPTIPGGQRTEPQPARGSHTLRVVGEA